jgi:ASC-1-like (ASCH) protein
MPVRHRMKLNPIDFEKVKSGEKKYELRLNDEKRKAFQVGERIELAKMPELETSVIVEITSLNVYKNFIELLRELPAAANGLTEEDFFKDVYTHYTEEEEQKYGVVAIGIKLA